MKIGIFGGSFNPIHVGHAIISSYIIQHTTIDQLWLMVAPQNPLKEKYANQIDDMHRLRMAELVSRRIEGVSTSGFEFSLPRPSYSIDTLRALSTKFPNDEFTLIIGADNWVDFHRWKDYETIISEYNIMIYPRHGYEINIPEKWANHVSVINAPIIEVSSTDIRKGLGELSNMYFYLPDDVYRYILENKLYL